MTQRGVRQEGDARLMRRVRRRLVAWSAGSTLVILVLLGAALYGSVRANFDSTGVTQLENRADELQREIARATGTAQGPDNPPGGEAGLGRPVFGGPASGTVAYLVDLDGDIVGSVPTIAGFPVKAGVDAALATTNRDMRTLTLSDTPVRVLSEPLTIGSETYVLQIVQDRSAEQRVLNILLLVLGLGGGAVLLTAAALGFFYAGRALVPIRESLRRQREFAADASHELRTPLAVVRGSVEYLRRNATRPVGEVGEALNDIETEVGHLTQLVEDLLLLARSDSGTVQLLHVPTDLGDVAGEALQGLRGQAQARGVHLELEAAPTTVSGDPERLRQLTTILVDNAIRHSPSGGSVTVRVDPEPSAVLSVEDEGPGIRPEDLPHVFDRFWRAPGAPPGGTGLGLAIGAWIAQHHGAVLGAENRPSGGARFAVRFPGR
jgi:two-component system, OmpR family, sensor histidine kinase CiaH